ncbi:Claudin-22 [Oryzias melastigma]|nr:putative claudin-24 [Oryzias melastigma]KAF6737213.1 Claudin-22 [Oryzias melastigma]
MDPVSQVLEQLGVLMSVVAWLCSLTTSLIPSWLSFSTDLLPAETFQLGLWRTCVLQDLGLQECRPYNNLLGMPRNIKLARILVCGSLGLGLMGLLLAVPGLDLVNGCWHHLEKQSCKRTLKAAGGSLCLISGLLDLVSVSHIAHMAVVQFFDETVPDVVPRWDFGDALFWGWTAGVLHLGAGVLLLTSCLNLDTHNRNLPVGISLVQLQETRHRARTRTEYV